MILNYNEKAGTMELRRTGYSVTLGRCWKEEFSGLWRLQWAAEVLTQGLDTAGYLYICARSKNELYRMIRNCLWANLFGDASYGAVEPK